MSKNLKEFLFTLLLFIVLVPTIKFIDNNIYKNKVSTLIEEGYTEEKAIKEVDERRIKRDEFIGKTNLPPVPIYQLKGFN